VAPADGCTVPASHQAHSTPPNRRLLLALHCLLAVLHPLLVRVLHDWLHKLLMLVFLMT
jgi:hypothetical protein